MAPEGVEVVFTGRDWFDVVPASHKKYQRDYHNCKYPDNYRYYNPWFIPGIILMSCHEFTFSNLPDDM